ncbi:MAG TPA: PfkB family carbohydrate kinase [Solirubrobacteraceae bacterium]|nr:PfkB family carbohydrate kinase [Solirubrobacteraceae bacterium]
MTRIVVVGHVEWVQFLRVDHLPGPGEIETARREAMHAGGGAVVAGAALAEHGVEVDFYGAIGSDDLGDAATADIAGRGIAVHMARRSSPTREVLTLLDHAGERTILPIGERLRPEGGDALGWERLAQADGAYVTAADRDALARARAARVLVVTPRLREEVGHGDLPIDALIYSASDENEARWAAALEPAARLVLLTEGANGGRWWGETEGRWSAVAPPGPVRDSYGCGDAFAAGVTFGLSAGAPIAEACAIGAQWGAEMLTRVGAP